MKEGVLLETKAAMIDFQSLETDWKQLCAVYLPIYHENSFWRFSCQWPPAHPEQGWKLHISATLLSASKTLATIGPFLRAHHILFKAPVSLLELKKMNCGLFYGFSQVGKCFTIYPQSTEQALALASMLDNLTEGMPGPSVPYDLPLRDGSCVYYRYGAFRAIDIETSEGTRVVAIRTPSGELYPDRREPGSATPNWVKNPFVEQKTLREKRSPEKDFLQEGILAYEAISQRGKGGVYRALDVNTRPARLCILKEGRKHGEVDVDRRDGYWRVRNEANVLSSLASAGVNVPKIYKTYEVQNHYYIAMEYIEGRNFQTVLLEKRNKITIREALSYGLQIARLLEKIHNGGWVWRDCKPLNLLLTEEGMLRPIDFEGACSLADADPSPWGSSGYLPLEWLKESPTGSRKQQDLYALGATLYQLFSGRIPVEPPFVPIGSLRRHIPPSVRKLISVLLHENPCARPDAHIVAHILESASHAMRSEVVFLSDR
jgi:tRNA A-37 threonylcarbamoyl transferase component Bud32